MLLQTAIDNKIYSLPFRRLCHIRRLSRTREADIARRITDEILFPGSIAIALADAGVRTLTPWDEVMRRSNYKEQQRWWTGQTNRPCTRCGVLTTCWCDGCEHVKRTNGRRGRALCCLCDCWHSLCPHCERKGVLLFSPGSAARVRHLQKRPELNGLVGIVLAYDAAAERYEFSLQDGREMLIRQANLARTGPPGQGVVAIETVGTVYSRVCSVCEVSDQECTLHRCSLCPSATAPWYCSKECQTTDWKAGHKRVCKRGSRAMG